LFTLDQCQNVEIEFIESNHIVFFSLLDRYTGHIHQLRYRFGRTYGEETHRLGKDYPIIKRSTSDIPIVKVDQSDPYETREFPDGMLPGYTGK
jgi:hypothetical protein